MRILGRPCGILPLLAAFATAQSAQEGTALLHQVADTYKNLKTYHFESVTENQLISELGHNTTTSRLTVASSGPHRLRVESTALQDWIVVISDGKALWRATPFTREYMRTTLSGPPLEAKGGGQEGGVMLRRSPVHASGYNDDRQACTRIGSEHAGWKTSAPFQPARRQ